MGEEQSGLEYIGKTGIRTTLHYIMVLDRRA